MMQNENQASFTVNLQDMGIIPVQTVLMIDRPVFLICLYPLPFYHLLPFCMMCCCAAAIIKMYNLIFHLLDTSLFEPACEPERQ